MGLYFRRFIVRTKMEGSFVIHISSYLCYSDKGGDPYTRTASQSQMGRPLTFLALFVAGRRCGPFHPSISGEGHNPYGWSILWHRWQLNGNTTVVAWPSSGSSYDLPAGKARMRSRSGHRVLLSRWHKH